MKPVIQDIFYGDLEGRIGNCFQAAIASIVEKPLNEVPHFAAIKEGTWFDSACQFLNDNGFDVFDCDAEEMVNIKDKIILVIGKSERGVNHSVIYKNGKLLHDPHPSQTGVSTIFWCAVIEPKHQP